MTTEEITNKLQNIFRKVFKEPDLEIFPEMNANDVDGWDSLSHMEMINETEYEFGIKFKIREIRRLKNVGEFIELIEKKVT